jgi:hypothetical protein
MKLAFYATKNCAADEMRFESATQFTCHCMISWGLKKFMYASASKHKFPSADIPSEAEANGFSLLGFIFAFNIVIPNKPG